MMNVARHGNKLLTEKEPWKLIKTDPEATATVLYDCVQIIANLSVVCEPFLPFTAAKLRQMLNIEKAFDWSDAGRADLIKGGHQLAEATLLFDKIEDDVVEKQLEKLHKNKVQMEEQKTEENTPTIAPQKSEINFEDFEKLDLRAGTILTAEKVEKADKLLKFSVDLGFEVRTIVSGIAAYFKPEDLIGKQVTVVANLAPRKIRGIESKGMILLAENEQGGLTFVTPENKVENGAVIR
ncbi:MAG: methionine--tRNA ligase subunit beta [Pirellulales bacterium]